MITHFDINGEQISVEKLSDDILYFSVCAYDGLIKSWEEHIKKGNLYNDESWYRKHIEDFKIKRNERAKTVNAILLQRHGKNYKGILFEMAS